MRVKDIASDGLIYALDPRSYPYPQGEQLGALKNILETQKFDAIPLTKKYRGPVTGLARRRLHDGDIHEVLILDIEEVNKLLRSDSILDAMFAVLGNEHHIALLYNGKIENGERPTDILTIEMLTDELVQDYLTLKIAELAAEGWNWNDSDLGKNDGGRADLGINICRKIGILAKLVEDGEINSDREVTSASIDVLKMLQPLKGAPITRIDSKPYVKPMTEVAKDATGLKTWPMVAVQDDEYMGFAYALLSAGNEFDRILISGDDYELIQRKKDSKEVERVKAQIIRKDESLSSIFKYLRDDSTSALVVEPDEGREEKWPGVVTIDDLASNSSVLSDMFRDAGAIEKKVKCCLIENGIYQVKTDRGNEHVGIVNLNSLFVQFANTRGIKKWNKDLATKFRRFRNAVAHQLFPELSDGVQPLPTYLHEIFLNGFFEVEKMKEELSGIEVSKSVKRKIELLEALHVFGMNKKIKITQYIDGIDISGSNQERLTFCLDQQIRPKEKKPWKRIATSIPRAYRDNPEWLDELGEFIDWEPREIEFRY